MIKKIIKLNIPRLEEVVRLVHSLLLRENRGSNELIDTSIGAISGGVGEWEEISKREGDKDTVECDYYEIAVSPLDAVKCESKPEDDDDRQSEDRKVLATIPDR